MSVIIDFPYGDGDCYFIGELNELIHHYTPMNCLEQSIAACLGRGIKKYYDQKGITENVFGKITINISAEAVNMRTDIGDLELLVEFVNICKECYILNHLTFVKKIIDKTCPEITFDNT